MLYSVPCHVKPLKLFGVWGIVLIITTMKVKGVLSSLKALLQAPSQRPAMLPEEQGTVRHLSEVVWISFDYTVKAMNHH